MTAAIKIILVLNVFIVWIFLSLSTEKSKAKVGKNIEESKMFSLHFFFWCVSGCANDFSLFLKSPFFVSVKCDGKNVKTTDGRGDIKLHFFQS